MEVFHYHKAVIDTNYKLWHDTNSEFYHDYMHYFNRATGMMQPGYFDRKYTGYPNGHASVGSMSIKYDAYSGSAERAVGWPGLAPGGWILIDIFPGEVLRFPRDPPPAPDGSPRKIPHMGWNEVAQQGSHPLWTGIPDRSRFYFVQRAP